MKAHFTAVVVVPCFNESKRLQLDTWLPYIDNHPAFLFIFINDGSLDSTQDVLKSIEERHNNVTLLEHQSNQGKASAVRSGMLYTLNRYTYDAIAYLDADLSAPLSELDRFLTILRANDSIDMILGSRVQMLGKDIQRNLFRHYVSRMIATFICKILDEPVYDTQCGLKLFRQDIVADLVQNAFISKWLFDVEILARYKIKHGSRKFKERLLEIPVSKWTEMENSKLKFYQVFTIIYELFKINKKYFHTRTL